MGAEGGVVWIPLRNYTDANYTRALELLKPFWHFLSEGGRSDVAEEGCLKWFEKNDVVNSIVGYYGTDRCDSFDLTQLEVLCSPEDPEDPIYDLTFEELDLDCRTSPVPIKAVDMWDGWQHPLHSLWYAHFHYHSTEEVVKSLGPLATMKASDWAKELSKLLHLDQCVSEETWT